MINQVFVSSFVKRQIKYSGKTYSNLSFDEIANYAKLQLNKGNYRLGYRSGVILIAIESKLLQKFTCPFIRINKNTQLSAKIVKRRKNEEPYIQIRALNGTLLKAAKVDLILYHHDVLKETDEQESSNGWELISFHAIPEGIDKMPMGTVTMARNQLELKGGTKGIYDSNEWAESVLFWQKYAVLETSKNN